MKDELKDNGIDIIVEEVERLKELNKQYYDSKDQEKMDKLLENISWKRISINSKLELLLDLDIINVDEWSIAYRLINILT